MRRAAMAVVVVGYAFGGIGPGAGEPAAHASTARAGTAHSRPVALTSKTVANASTTIGARKIVGAAAVKTVQYRGYQLSVPAGWPVYQLGAGSATCVRYDRHAVYVGVPGTDQQCPPGLIGRTETVSIGAADTVGRPPVAWQRAPVAGQGQRVMYQDARQRMFDIVLPGGAPPVTATYGSDPVVVEQVLASMRQVVPQAARLSAAELRAAAGLRADPISSPEPAALVRTDVVPAPSLTPIPVPVRSASAPPAAPSPAGSHSPAAAASHPPSAALHPPSAALHSPLAALRSPLAALHSPPAGASHPQPAPSVPATPQTPLSPAPLPSSSLGLQPSGSLGLQPSLGAQSSLGPQSSPAAGPELASTRPPLAGFDTCTAPSLRTMRAWRAKFAATAIYIGGEEMACGYGNLSSAWITAAKGMGWSLLPTYVGPQASCNDFSGKINLKKAVTQARQAAQDAVSDAAALGLGPGTPIYYDMEAYNTNKKNCVAGVLKFLDAWTHQIDAEGYVSGVYSSAGSGIMNIGSATTVAGHPFRRPQALWVALWDDASNLNATPYLPGGVWPLTRMSKQFSGSHWMKIKHITLDIDSDLVNSAVAR